MKYENGFNQMTDFFDYILSFAHEYKQASDVTVLKLGNFLKNLTEDKSHFIEDFNWLQNTASVKSAADMEKMSKDIIELSEKHGISTERMEELRKEISKTLNNIKIWSATAATITGRLVLSDNRSIYLSEFINFKLILLGVQGLGQLGAMASSGLTKWKTNSFNKQHMKAFNYPKHVKTKIDNYQAKYDKAYKANNINKIKKYDTKLDKWTTRLSDANHKNVAKITHKSKYTSSKVTFMKLIQIATKSGKWMGKFSKMGKAFGALNVGMSFVSMGFSIASAVEMAKEQQRLTEKKEE